MSLLKMFLYPCLFRLSCHSYVLRFWLRLALSNMLGCPNKALLPGTVLWHWHCFIWTHCNWPYYLETVQKKKGPVKSVTPWYAFKQNNSSHAWIMEKGEECGHRWVRLPVILLLYSLPLSGVLNVCFFCQWFNLSD